MQCPAVFGGIVVDEADDIQRMARVVLQLPEQSLARNAGADDDCRAAPTPLPTPERLFLYPAEQPALITAGTAERLFFDPARQKPNAAGQCDRDQPLEDD